MLINVTATYNGPDDKTTPLILISGVTSSNVEISELDNFVVAPDAFDVTADVFMGGSTTGNFVLTVPSAKLSTGWCSTPAPASVSTTCTSRPTDEMR